MSDQAYAPFLFNVPVYELYNKSVTGVPPQAGVGGLFPVINWMKRSDQVAHL